MMLAHAPDFLRVDSGLPLTMDMIDAYLEDLQKKGRQPETIRAYPNPYAISMKA